MAATRHPEDPDPHEPVPAGPLLVPVRPGPGGCTARFFRTPLGTRTAVGFTSAERLAAALGPDQPWVRLSAAALRALAEPLGVTCVTVDPRFCAPAPARVPAAPAAPVSVPTGPTVRRPGALRAIG
ncbi:SAV_915 family protein [Actinacidiphila sp. bgisy144]|uniref:SAV_915 family protein n=1 Tax=Actinacidiphila sp. bgisy144 TaxID=3413791 RepID=UPI003EBA5CA4